MKVCIAGGGRVGRYLAQSLLTNHHSVVIIEPIEAQCRMLADSLDIPVICGDSISVDTLRTADVASCDAFVAVTNTDETNLVACQIAKREFGVNRTVARASNPKNRDILHTLGVDTVVCGTDNLSHILEREIETDTIRQLLSLGGGTASLNEILLPEDFQFAGKEIKEIPIPGDAILVSITRVHHPPRQHGAAAVGPAAVPDTGRHPASADGCVGSFLPQMSEQELLRTALVLPPRARRVLCVWAAVPGLLCAPFAFWQSVWAGAVFCTVWAALVALVRVRCCSFVAALTADSVTVQSGVAVPVLHRIPRRAVTGVQLLRTPLLWAAGCTVLLVRSPGLQLVLPGIPAAQATALAAVLMEGNV